MAFQGGSQVEVRWDQGGSKVAFQGGSEVEVRWDQGGIKVGLEVAHLSLVQQSPVQTRCSTSRSHFHMVLRIEGFLYDQHRIFPRGVQCLPATSRSCAVE